jgi:hypothetical protein
MEIAKLKLNNGMILTVTITNETEEFIEGKDKNGYGVKVKKEDIASRIPVSY